MALIHQKLYQDSNLVGVETLYYIQSLAETVKSNYKVAADEVTSITMWRNNHRYRHHFIPIGLILNELISNSLKHAFPTGHEGKLSICLKEENSKLKLKVNDNGIGVSKDIKTSHSFGMRMIQSLSRKLEADFDFQSGHGAKASISISNYKLV
ncbi:MAG: hypothetical protein JXR03_10660 [Cyclobacteriaceae bacterium]